jgi:hypothetical protein
MESRRFDSFVRAFANRSTRRGVLGAAALASTAALTPAIARADGGNTAAGGGAAPCVCTNSERPARQITAAPPFPALIVTGTCDNYDASSPIDLNIVDASNQSQSEASTISVIGSQTVVSTSLADLLKSPHAIVLQASGADTTAIACGNLGSKANNNSLSIGIQEQNGSTYSGIANFTTTSTGLSVNLLVARGLFQTVTGNTSAAFAVGSFVIADVDLNLRETPEENGKVLAILGQGSELKVTGAAQGVWLPVSDAASGDSGYVNSTYVTAE